MIRLPQRLALFSPQAFVLCDQDSNPQVPAAGSTMRSRGRGSTICTIIRMIWRGVRNWHGGHLAQRRGSAAASA
jgi:hypothetical protein